MTKMCIDCNQIYYDNIVCPACGSVDFDKLPDDVGGKDVDFPMSSGLTNPFAVDDYDDELGDDY